MRKIFSQYTLLQIHRNMLNHNDLIWRSVQCNLNCSRGWPNSLNFSLFTILPTCIFLLDESLYQFYQSQDHVPDVRASQSSVLIGTNTLDILYENYLKQKPTVNCHLPHGYRAVLKILELRHKQSNDNYHGVVRMYGEGPQTIPAGRTTVLEGTITTPFLQSEKSVILEHPLSAPLPGGLMVKSCLVNLPRHQQCPLPVIILNESVHDIIIPAKAVIAKMSVIQSVIPRGHSDSVSAKTTSTSL